MADDSHLTKYFRVNKDFVVNVLMLATVVFAAYVYHEQLKEMMRANDLVQEALNKSVRDATQSDRNTQAALKISRDQLDAQQQQLKHAERALDMSERAWVLPSIEGPAFKPEGGSAVKVILRNAGKSPAFVGFSAEVSFEPRAPKISGYEGGITIAGGETSNPPLPHVIHFPIPAKADMEAIERGTKTLYVWVFVSYKDPIKAGRFTQLCAAYMAQYRRTIPCASQYQIFR